MTQEVIKTIGYSGTLQRFVVPDNFAPTVTAYLWGGGGGGGGNDRYAGANGSGGGYATKTLTISPGDIIDVAVGGNGTGGQGGRGVAGGNPGASYYPSMLFNSRNPPPLVSGVALTNVSNPAWTSFLNTYGVWNNSVNYVDNTYNLVVPNTGTYIVTLSTDNYGYVYIDGIAVASSSSFSSDTQGSVILPAGNHTLRIQGYNTGGPGGIGVTVTDSANVFDSRTATPDFGVTVTPASYTSWQPWFNAHAVSTSSTDIYYTVNFPTTGYYDFSIGADWGMEVYLDGSLVSSCTDYTGSWNPPSPASTTSVYVTAGAHTVRVVWSNDGGTNGWAMVISGTQSCFSGGRGGYSGYSGSSGAGGGGGGATVLLLNGSVVAVAGGGAGGGGGGNYGSGGVPPGPGGSSPIVPAGQNGEDKAGDGGGGGGGGGGYRGGNGGSCPGGDVGGNAGFYGTSTGDVVTNPSSSTQAANSNSPYRYGNPGQGGAAPGLPGTSGQATFVFGVAGTYVYNIDQFVSVKNTYVKNNGVWTPVKSTWVKDNGIWKKVQGNFTVNFGVVGGNFGIASRPY